MGVARSPIALSGADVTARGGLPEEPRDAAPPPSKAKRTRRNRITRNACRQCRQKKSKCDGQHPICARCKQGDGCCTYDVSEGVTKMQSLKDRLSSLSKDRDRLTALLRVLVEASDQDATMLLAKLRLARANGEGVPDDLPACLDPRLFRDSPALSSLLNVSNGDSSTQYSRDDSITNHSSLDNDPSRFVSSPDESKIAFTCWDGFQAPDDCDADTSSSHTTGSPGSMALDGNPPSHQVMPSSSFSSQGGQGQPDMQDPHRRMSSTMPGWPYSYVTGAAGGPGYYPPPTPNGVECTDWASAGQHGGSTYHLSQQGQGQGWGGQ